MPDAAQFKVCGLTSLVDADVATECGADYLGFIFYPQSPRRISLEQFAALMPRLPSLPKVAVSVEPTLQQLIAFRDAGFDYFQIHFRHDLPLDRVRGWSETVGESRLWLAPKLPPATDLPKALLDFARFFLLDTFAPDAFGGSGRTGDWAKFARHRQANPDKTWILAGGLNPENIFEARRQSGARLVDVNSGVETAPGIKDHAKLKAFAAALRGLS